MTAQHTLLWQEQLLSDDKTERSSDISCPTCHPGKNKGFQKKTFHVIELCVGELFMDQWICV